MEVWKDLYMTYLAAKVSNESVVGFYLNDKKTKPSKVRQTISLLSIDMKSVLKNTFVLIKNMI